MIKINLLPWREKARKRHMRIFYRTLVGCVGSGIVVMAFFHLSLQQDIEYLESRHHIATKTFEKLTEQQVFIEKLARKQNGMAHLFDALLESMPEGITLNDAVFEGASLSLSGIADAHGSVSQFLRNLAESQWFNDPTLIKIHTEPDALWHFTVTVKHHAV